MAPDGFEDLTPEPVFGLVLVSQILPLVRDAVAATIQNYLNVPTDSEDWISAMLLTQLGAELSTLSGVLVSRYDPGSGEWVQIIPFVHSGRGPEGVIGADFALVKGVGDDQRAILVQAKYGPEDERLESRRDYKRLVTQSRSMGPQCGIVCPGVHRKGNAKSADGSAPLSFRG